MKQSQSKVDMPMWVQKHSYTVESQDMQNPEIP